jgi:hypothetical protein
MLLTPFDGTQAVSHALGVTGDLIKIDRDREKAEDGPDAKNELDEEKEV